MAPSMLVNGALQPDLDLCRAMRTAHDNDVITIRGSRGRPVNLAEQAWSAPTGFCSFNAGADGVIVRGEGDPLIIGQLSLSNADGWVLDGLSVTPAANASHEPVVKMLGGNGWRWTNCEIFGGSSVATMSIGNWTGKIPTNFRLDHCFIHDNAGDPGYTDNRSHNLYVFTVDEIPANGIIEDNLIVHSPRGWNVKIGGTGLYDHEGSDMITLRRNTLVNNRYDGSNLLVSTDSDDVSVSNNIFVAQGTASPVNFGLSGFEGSNLQAQDNVFFGYNPNARPKPRPIMSSYYGAYEAIDLNEFSLFLTQARNVRRDPNFPALQASNPNVAAFPSVSAGGVTYGAAL